MVFAGVLGELGGGRLLDEGSAELLGEAHAFTVDAGARFLPQGQRVGVAAKAEATSSGMVSALCSMSMRASSSGSS